MGTALETKSARLNAQVREMLKQGATVRAIRETVGVGEVRITNVRRELAEGDLSGMPVPAWVWPENRDDYRRIACLPITDDGGEYAAARWARDAQRVRPRAGQKPAGGVAGRKKALWARPRVRDADGWRRPNGGDGPPALAHLRRCVSLLTGVPVIELTGPTRAARCVKARQIAFYLLNTIGKASLNATGAAMGGRDHTCVVHAVARVEAALPALALPQEANCLELIEALWAAQWPSAKSQRRQR